MGLSYGQSASLGQALEGIGNNISTIFDPRLAAMAAKSNLESQANALEMKYKPQLYQSQIAQNQASAGAAGAAAAYHNAQTQLANQKALYQKEAVNYPMPTGHFAGVPYAADVMAAPTPEEIQNSQNAIAIRLAAAGENPYNWAQSAASIKGQNANTELGARQSVVGQGGALPNVNQAFTTDTQGKVIAAQGANDIAKQAETNKGNLQQKFLEAGMQGIFPSAGSGLKQGASTLDIKDLEAIDKYVQGKFTLPGGQLSAENIPAANAYANTLKTLMGQGIPSAQADQIAASYHGGAEYSNGVFSSEKMQPSKGFIMTPMPLAKAAEMGYQFKNDEAQRRNSSLAQAMNFYNGAFGEQPVGLPVPAPKTPEQAAAPVVPATGPVAAPTRTGPITLGEKAAASKAEEKRKKDLAYNQVTMDRLLPLVKAKNQNLNEVYATALTGGEENRKALQEALNPSILDQALNLAFSDQYGGNSLSEIAGASPSLTDIQNALRSSAIQSQYGIKPEFVNQYLPQGNAGQAQIGRFIVNQ
jgi:hypothetical protein